MMNISKPVKLSLVTLLFLESSQIGALMYNY